MKLLVTTVSIAVFPLLVFAAGGAQKYAEDIKT
jgi:hypothetical protein